MGRGRKRICSVDGAWFTMGSSSLLVVGIMGTRLEKQTNFLCNFISFRYVRPCPMGLFYFGVFILYYRVSKSCPFLTVKYHANLPVRRRRRCGVCATG